MVAIYDVSNPCNYRCTYCRNDWDDNKNLNHTKLEDIKNIIDNISGHGFKAISYTGGEFFLIPFWREVLSYAKEKGLINQVITNAALIKDEDIQFLEEHVKRINVSFHSSNKKLYKEIMGIKDNSVFDKVINNLKAIAQSKMELGIFFSPLRSNYEDFYKTIRDLQKEEIEITDVNLNRILPVENAKDFFAEEKPLGYFEHRVLIQQLIQINKKLGIDAFAEAYPICYLDKIISDKELIKKINRPCIVGRKAIAIDSEGNLKICPCTAHLMSATIKDTKERIVGDKIIKEFNNDQWRNNYCDDCSDWRDCLGACHSSQGAVFSDDNLLIDDEVELKEGIEDDFFDLLIDLYDPFLGSSFRNAKIAYTVFSKNKYKHPIGIIALKEPSYANYFLEIAIIPQLKGKYYSFLILEKLSELHPKITKVGWTSHKANLPSMKVLQKLRGGFFEDTVKRKRRKEGEGFYRVEGKATKKMRKSLNKQIQLTKPKFEEWLKDYKERDEEQRKLKKYLEEYNENN